MQRICYDHIISFIHHQTTGFVSILSKRLLLPSLIIWTLKMVNKLILENVRLIQRYKRNQRSKHSRQKQSFIVAHYFKTLYIQISNL